MSGGYALQVALWLAVVAFALWRGRRPVRIVALTLLIALVASLVFWGRADRNALKPHLVAADLLTLAACFWAVLRTKAVWSVVATGCQILSLLAYVAKAVDRSLHSWGYLTLAVIWGYGVLGSVLAGALQRRPL